MWTNDKKKLIIYSFFILQTIIITTVIWQILRWESKLPTMFFFKCSTVLKHCIFPGENLWCKKRRRKEENECGFTFCWNEATFFCCQSVADMSAYLQNDLNRLRRWLDKRLLCLPLPFHPFTSIIIIWKKLFLLLPCALLSFPTKTTKKHPNRPVTFLLIVIHIVWLSVLNAELFKLFTVCGFVLRLLFNSALPQSC